MWASAVDAVSIEGVLALARDAGLIGLLVAVLFGGWKDVWCWSRQRTAVERERDEWKAIALRGTELADQSLSLAAEKQAPRRRA